MGSRPRASARARNKANTRFFIQKPPYQNSLWERPQAENRGTRLSAKKADALCIRFCLSQNKGTANTRPQGRGSPFVGLLTGMFRGRTLTAPPSPSQPSPVTRFREKRTALHAYSTAGNDVPPCPGFSPGSLVQRTRMRVLPWVGAGSRICHKSRSHMGLLGVLRTLTFMIPVR